MPGLSKAAAAAGRPSPRVIVGLPVAVCDDLDEGIATVEAVFARYGGLDNYKKVFALEGVDKVSELAIMGTEAQVEAHLQRLAGRRRDRAVARSLPGRRRRCRQHRPYPRVPRVARPGVLRTRWQRRTTPRN